MLREGRDAEGGRLRCVCMCFVVVFTTTAL